MFLARNFNLNESLDWMLNIYPRIGHGLWAKPVCHHKDMYIVGWKLIDKVKYYEELLQFKNF